MANLSIQLLLYTAAWLALGAAVKEHRKSCWAWATGWWLTSLATLCVFVKPVWAPQLQDAVINLLVMSAFVGIYRGLTQFAGQKMSLSVTFFAYTGLLLLEVARWLRPDWLEIRVWLFTVAFAGPVSAIIHLLWVYSPAWFRRRRATQILLVFPAVLTLVVFVVRAMVTSFGAQPETANLESSSTFSLVSTTSFLVFLGFFNFSLFALVLGAMIHRLDNLSSKDQLTGLNNRRVMLEQLATEHARFLRGGPAYALVMMDLDHFKHINDSYGHLVGDEVLRIVAQRLRSAMRDSDLIARFGGEEFLLLLPGTDLAGACKQAERMRHLIGAEFMATSAGPVPLTISIGVTLARLIDVDAMPAMARADAALYQAKAQGRNCLRAA